MVRVSPDIGEGDSKTHTAFPVARTETQGSGLWGTRLSSSSVPPNPVLLVGRVKAGEGLCCYACKLPVLVATTSLSPMSAPTGTM